MHKKVLALVLAAVLLSGCDMGGGNSENRNSADNTSSPDVSSQNSSSLPHSPAQNSETGSEPRSEGSAASTNNNSEENAPVKTDGMPEEISDYIGSLDNGDFVFVDYTFDESPELITDASLLGDICGKALEVLKATDDYAFFSERYADAELLGRFTENSEDFLDENGRFERSDKQVRTSDTPGNTGSALNTLEDVDYDAAVASMLTPEEAARLER